MKETHTQFSGFLDSFGDNLVKKGYFKINTSCDFSSGNWINPTERKKIWCSEGFMWAKGCSVQYDFENDKEMIEDVEIFSKRFLIVEKMEQAIELLVPLKVEWGIGDHWLAAH